MNKLLLFLLAPLLLTACNGGGQAPDEFTEEVYTPQYARGFRVKCSPWRESTIIETISPWQGADSVCTRLLLLRDEESAPRGFDGQTVRTPVRRVVCMSLTHVAMLEAIGATDRVVGVSGRSEILPDAADVGYDGALNHELLLSLNPDLMLIYGVGGAAQMEGKLKELGIPFIYVSDYLEPHPLGQAEWMVALGEILDIRDGALESFQRLPIAYNEVKERAQEAAHHPAVMVNSPWGDSWFMPSTRSYLGQLMADAGGDYIYKENDGPDSVPIDIETATALADRAEVWLTPGQATTMAELRRIAPKNADTRARVYNHRADYWERGAAAPHLLLRDLCRIFHPELEQDTTLIYFYRL